MFCKHCGTKANAAGFCTRCGKPLTLPDTQRPEHTQQEAGQGIKPQQPPAEPSQVIGQAAYSHTPPARKQKSAAREDPRRRGRRGKVVSLLAATVFVFLGAWGGISWVTGSFNGDSLPTAAEGSYGSDDNLDLLWDRCKSGTLAACDDLYFAAPAGSEYGQFGATCGNQGGEPGLCSSQDTASDFTEGGFGSDPQLDLLYVECEEGNMMACDDLFFEAAPGTAYEDFGATCGARGDGNGNCVSIF